MANKQSRNIIDIANRRLSVKVAAVILASSTLLSSLLGIFRDRLLNSMYYDTYSSGIDAYTMAFQIPDFMFSIIVSGALTVTFIPVFNQLRNDKRYKDNHAAWELATSMINLMSLVSLIISVLIIVFADPLIRYVAGPGLNESSRNLAISMMRIIAINPFLFSIAGIVSSMQQSFGRYVFYALAPMIYNIGIIIGTMFFTNGVTIFGFEIFEGGIMGVALGVLLGAVCQLLVSVVGLIGLGFDYRFKIYWQNQGFRKVLRLFPARSLDQGADYLNSLVETRLASGMASGTIRAYNQALTLRNMPVNLIGVAISNAAFASMTEKLGLGRIGEFKKEVQMILRTIIFIALPISVIAFFTRGYLVNFIKNGGNMLMSTLLGALIIAIFFRSVYHILARTFYAQQDTKTPLVVSLIAIGFNIVMAVYLIKFRGYGAIALAWSQSATAVLEVTILSLILRNKTKGLIDSEFISAFIKILFSVIAMSFVCYTLVKLLPLKAVNRSLLSTLPKFLIISGVSGIFYLIIAKVLKLKEADIIIDRIIQIVFPKPAKRGQNGKNS